MINWREYSESIYNVQSLLNCISIKNAITVKSWLSVRKVRISSNLEHIYRKVGSPKIENIFFYFDAKFIFMNLEKSNHCEYKLAYPAYPRVVYATKDSDR